MIDSDAHLLQRGINDVRKKFSSIESRELHFTQRQLKTVVFLHWCLICTVLLISPP
jgi:hypothetical protein